METIQAFLVITIFGMAVSICLASCRLIRGPTAPDRVLAGDTATNAMLAMIVLLSVYYRESMLLDMALLLAFLGFIGTLAVSKYLEGRGLGD